MDRIAQPHLKRSMTDAQTWMLNHSYPFENTVDVKLWDEDAIGTNDYLGAMKVEATRAQGATASFTNAGANYKLWYEVC